MEDKKVNQKYLYNGRRIKLIESTITDIGFDPDNPIVIYDSKIRSEVGSGKQLTDGSYSGFVACGMHALDVRAWQVGINPPLSMPFTGRFPATHTDPFLD